MACRTAPGGDGWGFAYYMPNTDCGWLETCDCENCGTEGRSREYNQWRPTFPVTGLVCYDLTGVEGIHVSNLSDLIERARHCRDHGNFDALHGDLLEMVEFLESEFEAERDRASEHFDKRMDLLARLRGFGRDCVEHGDMTPSGERALMSQSTTAT